MKKKCFHMSIVLGLLMMITPAFAEDAHVTGEKHEESVINEYLPEWINVDVEARHRFEYRDNFDLNDSVDDKDGFNLWRTRVGVALKPTKQIKLYYQMQDARISHDMNYDSSKSKLENWADTKKLYLKFSDLFAYEPLGLAGISFIVGRQPLSYGDGRLLGDPDWANVGQAFDAVKTMFHFKDISVDFFAGYKKETKSPREHDDIYEGGSKDRVAGYYATFTGIINTTIEQYMIQRKTNVDVLFGPSASGELDEYTAGARVVGRIGETHFDYEVDSAYQWGEMNALDISAWMAIVKLGYTFDHAWKPRLGFEFDYASGDSDKTDGTRNTFDNLYPDNHEFYGQLDRVGLQNLLDYSVQLAAKPLDKLKLRVDFHFLFLDTTNDYLYDADLKKVRSTTGSDFSAHVGNEIDLQADYQLTKYWGIQVGYSHLFAGKFFDDTGEQDDADFAYVQTTLKF